ncbi:MAG: Iojap-related protein [Gammaproteobacteria bacterium]|nr:Iojap-related protein [Gammaproteobacteria bacterium]
MKPLTIKKLTALIVAALEELKAYNIQVLDVTSLTSITDVMIIASGRSNRQVRAIADKVLEKLRAAGISTLGIEGEQEAEWILVDAGDAVIHIMQPVTRTYYQLEKLWNTKELSSNTTTI